VSGTLKIGVACYPKAGGSGIVATELGLALAARGHELHFICSRAPFRLRDHHDEVQLHLVETADYPLFDYPPYTLALAVKMQQVIEDQGLDLMHVHYAIPHAASALLARDMNGGDLPIVTTLHGTDITLVGRHPSYHRITRHCIDRSDAVTSVSDWLALETAEIFGTERELVTIPNFVDTERFRPGNGEHLRQRYAPHGEKLLLHASNFRPVKRAGFLLDVFTRLKRMDQAVLLLAGDGPELGSMRQRVRELGLDEKVHFLGAWDDMESLLPAADLFLLPSAHESFGLVALEAASCGVPSLVTDRGGPPEHIETGVNGFLLDPEDADAWAATVDRLLASDELRERISAQARSRVLDRYRLDAVVDQYEALFRRCVAGSRSQGAAP